MNRMFRTGSSGKGSTATWPTAPNCISNSKAKTNRPSAARGATATRKRGRWSRAALGSAMLFSKKLTTSILYGSRSIDPPGLGATIIARRSGFSYNPNRLFAHGPSLTYDDSSWAARVGDPVGSESQSGRRAGQIGEPAGLENRPGMNNRFGGGFMAVKQKM